MRRLDVNRFILILFLSRHTMHNTFDFVSCNVHSSQMISVVVSTMVVIVIFSVLII